MKRVLLVLSDIHARSTVAVCPPKVRLDDGGTYQASTAQQWLYRNWCDFWERSAKARRKADWCGLLLNGDAFDGDHHNTGQLITRNPATEQKILWDLLAPALDLKLHQVIVVRGTESHVGKEGAAEEEFARTLSGKVEVAQDPETGDYSWWHYRGDIGPCRLDATHHGKTGHLPWTKPAATQRLAAQIFYEHAKRGWRHPDLCIRSHFHQLGDSYDAHPTRVIQTGAWQLKTAYVHAKAPEGLADIAGLIVTITDHGPVEVEKVHYHPDPPTVMEVA